MPNPQINPRPAPGRPTPQHPKPAQGINPAEVVKQNPTQPAGASTGAKAATVAGITIGGAGLAFIVVAAVTGWGINKTLDKTWDLLSGKKKKRRR